MSRVRIVSRETIKPCSPTPPHLGRWQLSLLEQLLPPVHTPLILFYSGNETAGKSSCLKKSLSEILTRFYPLAGRVRQTVDSCYVDCNDEGVEYIEAHVDGEISEILRKPAVSELFPFLPDCVGSGDILLAVQINMFDCGGLAISVSLSHKIADASSMTTLLQAWTDATYSGGDVQVCRDVVPIFNSAAVFPPRPLQQKAHVKSTLTQKVVSKRLLFEASKIKLLRENANPRPTRVEAVSALIWRCCARAQGEAGRGMVSVATQAVNVRGRLVPPLPEYSFGNLWLPAVSSAPIEQVVDGSGKDGRRFLEGRLRDAIGRVTGEFVKKVGEQGGVVELFASSKVEQIGFHYCYFSSLCWFPFYELDFGWGKPEWVSNAELAVKNTVILMGTRCGEGIEAWVNMDEEEMGRFERDEELLGFVSSI